MVMLARLRNGVFPLLLVLASALPARANCNVFSFSVSQPIVDNFIFRRSNLLADNPRGGDTLQRQVTILVASSRAARPGVLLLFKKANKRQIQAIAAGFGAAASRCRARSAIEARTIEKAVRALRDPEILQAFNETFHNPEQALADRESASKAEALGETLRSGMPVRRGSVPLGSDAIEAPGRIEPIRPMQPFARQ